MPADPSHTYTFDTRSAVPPREGGIGTLPGTEWRKDEHIASQKRAIKVYRDEIARMTREIHDLKAEKAAQGEQVRDQAATIARLTTELAHAEGAITTLRAELAQRDEAIDSLHELIREHKSMLRTILFEGRVAGDESLAADIERLLPGEYPEREPVDASPSPGPLAKPIQCPCGEIASRVDTEACARCGRPAGGSPPGPRGTPEGERSDVYLAKLERVARTAKAFFRVRSEDPTDDVYTLFRMAVTDLLVFEAQS